MDNPYESIARQHSPGATLVSHRPLVGGVSASVEGLVVQCADGSQDRVVVRRHGATDWKQGPNDVTAMEYRLLQALEGSQVPVPQPRWLDQSGDVLPSPYFVMSWLEGEVQDEPTDAHIDAMAYMLRTLHDVDVANQSLPALPTRSDPGVEARRDLPDNPWADRVRALEPLPRPARISLLHGDYWTGNLLWRDDQIVAVLDWEDAAVGDPMADLAGARVELLWRGGRPMMERFTTAYEAHAPVDHARLRHWDVYVAAAGLASMQHWGLDPAVEAVWRERTVAFLQGRRH